MTQPLTITLRNRSFTADSPTDTELMTLTSLILPGENLEERVRFAQKISDPNSQAAKDFDLSKPENINWMAPTILARLADPITKALIAHTLVTIFPTLPSEWVSYKLVKLENGDNHQNFRYKLNAVELLPLILEVVKHTNASSNQSSQEAATAA